MARTHRFACTTRWTGADRGPILSYDDYSRDHMIEIAGKPALACSADGTFLGDSSRHNPEDLLVAALSACHLLSYLAFCARAGVAVVAYEDAAEGTMTVRDRRMRFTEVVLRPRVAVAAESSLDQARALHEAAHDACFIANSVNFPVRCEAVVEAENQG